MPNKPAPAEPSSAMAAQFKTPFAEQVTFFRGKLGRLVPTARWDDLWHGQHDKAFMVAGAAKADLLADLAGAVDKAIADGETLDKFRKRFDGIVGKHGWHGWTGEGSKAGQDWRTRIIYQTNLSSSYSAGRLAQLRAGGYTHYMYKHSDSVAHPRPHHLALNGVVQPAESDFWQRYYPPNGWGCRCRVVGVRNPAQAKRLGGDWDKPTPGWTNDTDPKTGEPPGIDKGWGYMPGGSVADTVRALAGKVPKLPAEIGARLGAELPLDKLTTEFGQFFDNAITNRARPTGQTMVVGALLPNWVAATKAAGVLPASAEIAIRDRDIAHTFRDAKAHKLSAAWFKNLPAHLRHPQAVILDVTHQGGPALLLVFDAGAAAKKLVVRVNYRVKKGDVLNIVETGQTVDASGIASGLGKGYTLIDGAL